VVPPLTALIFRKFSASRWAFGKTNGRPHLVSAQHGLYPKKLAASVINMIQPIHTPPAKIDDAMTHLSEAMDYMYRAFRIRQFGTEMSRLSFSWLKDMYLGASAGKNKGVSKFLREYDGEPLPTPISIGPGKKKIDTLESDPEAILTFLRTGKDPPIWWQTAAKNEYFFDFAKQMSDKEWEAFCMKLRLFVIPSSVFILMEKMVSKVRHLKERGWVIQVGHKWPKGGMDRLARCLGISLMNAFKRLIVEGDVKKFDQTVLELFVTLYFSTMQIHEVPGTVEYEITRLVVECLMRNIITRITNVYADYWVSIRGGVPSGCFNTSHMDSWIMSLYFFLFGVYQIHNAPEDVKEGLELHFLETVRIIVYGDDHLYNKGEGEYSAYFGGHVFAKFLHDHFGVVLRDIYDGLPFCSTVSLGWVIDRGATFLQHQAILNPNKGEGQSIFLPFRESRALVVRAIWGREAHSRDVLDVLMSCIGHAYGTFGSNEDAYWRLRFLYGACLDELEMTPSKAVHECYDRVDGLTIKKLRQIGVSREELLQGFPEWETLVSKNVVDWDYQDITTESIEEDNEYVSWS